jgi:hypothetical protein
VPVPLRDEEDEKKDVVRTHFGRRAEALQPRPVARATGARRSRTRTRRASANIARLAPVLWVEVSAAARDRLEWWRGAFLPRTELADGGGGDRALPQGMGGGVEGGPSGAGAQTCEGEAHVRGM